MAVHFHPCVFPPISRKLPFPAPKSRFRFSTAAFSMRVESSVEQKTGAVILWYKHDLRIEDHPGIIAASKHRYVVSVYISDRRILSRFSDKLVELLLFALEDLRKLLREQSSDLMTRIGTAESVTGELINEVLRVIIDIIKESLHTLSFSRVDPNIVMASTPFYDVTSIKNLPVSFDDLKKLKLLVVSPIVPPKLTGHELNISWGSLPTLAELKCFLEVTSDASNIKSKWTSIKQFSARSGLQQKKLQSNFTTREAKLQENNGNKGNQRNKLENSAFKTFQWSSIGGGASIVLNALAAYLRYLKGNFSMLNKISVVCTRVIGVYFPSFHLVVCKCGTCESENRSLSEWKRHTGYKTKNWKSSVRVKGSLMELHCLEKKAVENEIDLDVLRRKRKEFDELEDMKKCNHDLELENYELAQKFEYLQMLATSALDNEEVQEIHKKSWCLRHENGDLKKKPQQLKFGIAQGENKVWDEGGKLSFDFSELWELMVLHLIIIWDPGGIGPGSEWWFVRSG